MIDLGDHNHSKITREVAVWEQLKRIADALENFNFEQVGEYKHASTQEPLTAGERAELAELRFRMEGLDK